MIEVRIPNPHLVVTKMVDEATGETSLHVGTRSLGPLVELLIPRGEAVEVTDQEWKVLHFGATEVDYMNPHGVTVGEEG